RVRDAGLVQVVVGVSSVMAFQEKVITGAGVAPDFTLGQGGNLVERIRPSDRAPQCHSRLLHSQYERLVQPARDRGVLCQAIHAAEFEAWPWLLTLSGTRRVPDPDIRRLRLLGVKHGLVPVYGAEETKSVADASPMYGRLFGREA